METQTGGKMECGSIDTPPSRSNMTIWGIVEFVIMIFIGASCLLNVLDTIHYTMNVWNIVWFVGNAFGVAGLIFVILGLLQSNGRYFNIGMICFFINIVISIVCIVFSIIGYGSAVYFGTIVTVCLDIFMAYVLWRQSSHLQA